MKTFDLNIAWLSLNIVFYFCLVLFVVSLCVGWYRRHNSKRQYIAHDVQISIEMNPETEPGVFTPIDRVIFMESDKHGNH